jgi:DMSO/TMAO reductase YedYZ molybdopterin-dependent catalytic subunit
LRAPEAIRTVGVAGWQLPLQNGQEARAFFGGAMSTNMYIDITVPMPFIG